MADSEAFVTDRSALGTSVNLPGIAARDSWFCWCCSKTFSNVFHISGISKPQCMVPPKLRCFVKDWNLWSSRSFLTLVIPWFWVIVVYFKTCLSFKHTSYSHFPWFSWPGRIFQDLDPSKMQISLALLPSGWRWDLRGGTGCCKSLSMLRGSL